MSITRRLYYDDAYTHRFNAAILERIAVAGQPAVVLDQTCFYPEGGGQPADRGLINGVEVLDVITREDDHAVLHVLAREVEGDRAECEVDMARRFDHMQHHTGQHVLTRAFIEVADAATVGFHLSQESVTIDLDKELDAEQIDRAEALANQIVYENRTVTSRLLDPGEEDRVRMRKAPEHLATGRLRVIEIADFDLTACGGTHVARTGEIGMIKVLRVQRHRTGMRVEFCCGWRALYDYRQKNTILLRLSADLTVGYWEVEAALERLRADLKAKEKQIKQARGELLQHRAARLLADAPQYQGLRVVRQILDGGDVAEMRALASLLVEAGGTVALLGVAGQPAHLLLARSADLSYDMSALIHTGLALMGSARGGGRAEMAQGGGVPADPETVERALLLIESLIVGRQDG
ncbi:MAG: DHHA1 domain-containing protein [Anaerolineae bacterium]